MQCKDEVDTHGTCDSFDGDVTKCVQRLFSNLQTGSSQLHPRTAARTRPQMRRAPTRQLGNQSGLDKVKVILDLLRRRLVANGCLQRAGAALLPICAFKCVKRGGCQRGSQAPDGGLNAVAQGAVAAVHTAAARVHCRHTPIHLQGN